MDIRASRLMMSRRKMLLDMFAKEFSDEIRLARILLERKLESPFVDKKPDELDEGDDAMLQ